MWRAARRLTQLARRQELGARLLGRKASKEEGDDDPSAILGG